MLYQTLADRLQALISEGVYPVGSALPGVRRLSGSHGVSVSTVVSAARELERRGILEARPRSGYYVLPPAAQRAMPRARPRSRRPQPVTGQEQLLQIIQSVQDPAIVNFGTAVPDPDYMPAAVIENVVVKQSWTPN